MVLLQHTVEVPDREAAREAERVHHANQQVARSRCGSRTGKRSRLAAH